VIRAMNSSPAAGLPWDEILNVAVHDMRTPLSSMRSTLEIIRMLNPDCAKTSTLVDKLDKQVMEIAAHLDRLCSDPASYRR
jgi:hypothetical protein